MQLVIDPEDKGLWRHKDWKPGMPGLYALVVGISSYPHLDGGTQVAPGGPHRMGQLYCSARTAASIFQWLCGNFRRRDLPLVWAKLLLSPNAKELQWLQEQGLAHYGTPDYRGLYDAMQQWTGIVPLAEPASRSSRTLFFFSGHGVASNNRPVLLPSDYLSPKAGAPKYQNCISARELRDWIEYSPVLENLALFDACQNEYEPLQRRGAKANDCIEVPEAGARGPQTAAAMSATSSNMQAYQPPEGPLSYFGAAVLEALRGIEGGDDTELALMELVDYVRPRVNELLLDASGGLVRQTVMPWVFGDPGMVVTEFDPPGPVPAGAAAEPAAASGHDAAGAFAAPGDAGAVLPPAARSRGGALEGRRRSRPHAGPRRAAPVSTQRLLQAQAAVLTQHTVEPIPLEVLQHDFGECHRRFGHEYASHPWCDGLAVHALDTGELLAYGAATVAAVERNDASSRVQVDLELAPRSGGLLLVFQGEQHVHKTRLAVALPTSTREAIPIRLMLDFGPAADEGPWRLQRIEALLGPGPDAASTDYGYLWALAREADLGSLRQAAQRAEPARAGEMADAGQPVAAAALALLLARGGRLAELGEWPRELMLRCDDLPDAALLWAEALRLAWREDKTPFGLDAPIETIRQTLATVARQGLPYFAASHEIAGRLLRFVAQVHTVQGDATRELLDGLAQRLEKAADLVPPGGGHFPTLAGRPVPHWLAAGREAVGVDDMLALLQGEAIAMGAIAA